MKKLTTFFSVASLLILGVIFFAQKAYANPIAPGQEGTSLPNNQNELIIYGVVGGIIVVVIVVAVIVLNKIRKKNVNK